MSYSSVQIQSGVRERAFIPYSGCNPIHKLSDITGEEDVFLPIDFFATNPDWRYQYNLTKVMDMPLRPCGGLYYWIPTDRITLTSSSGASILLDRSDLSWDELSIPSESPGTKFPYTDPTTGEFVWADPSSQKMRAWSRSNIHSVFVLKTGTIERPLKSGTYTVHVNRCRDLNESGKFVKLCTTEWIGISAYFLASVYFAVSAALIASLMAYFTVRPNPQRISLFN